MRAGRGRALAVTVLLVALTGCGGGATAQSQAATTPFPVSEESVAVEAGTYLIPKSAWSVADFTVTFPEGWTVQYGHVYATYPAADIEIGFYPVVVDAIHADACVGSGGELMDVGPTVDGLADALLQQQGPAAQGPVKTTLGGVPATRIDLTVPEGFDLGPCNVTDIGLQIWHSPPGDKNFVLLRDAIASVYILDLDGQRQVFLTQSSYAASDDDMRELQEVLDSIRLAL